MSSYVESGALSDEDVKFRLREREREYQGRLKTMARLRERAAKAAEGKAPRAGRHTLVSNPFRALSEAQAGRVMEVVEEIHTRGYAVYRCVPEAGRSVLYSAQFLGMKRPALGLPLTHGVCGPHVR